MRNSASLSPKAAYRLGRLTPTALVRSDRVVPSYPFRQKTCNARSRAPSISKERGRPSRPDDLLRLMPCWMRFSYPSVQLLKLFTRHDIYTVWYRNTMQLKGNQGG